MKKLFLFFIYGMLLTNFIWGDPGSVYDISDFKRGTTENNEIIRGLFNGKKVYFFDGFRFETYKEGDPGLAKLNEEELNFIWKDLRPTKPEPTEPEPEEPEPEEPEPTEPTESTEPEPEEPDPTDPTITNPDINKRYSIIGYSQGGLRALGYITRKGIEQKYGSVDNIDAVITISGINQGLPLLEGDLIGLKQRIFRPVNILYNGIISVMKCPILFILLIIFIPEEAITFISDILPSEWDHYVAAAWDSPDHEKWEQLHDMAPESEYIKKYVADVATYTYKMQSGRKFILEWRKGRLWTGYVPVYKYYEFKTPVPNFNSEVPIGFIAGTNSKTLSMLVDDEREIKNYMDKVANVFCAAQAIHFVKSALIFGHIIGSPAMASNAFKAKVLMKDFESELNTLKRSKENDGLVALNAQYYPETMYDKYAKVDRVVLRNPVLHDSKIGYTEVPENHKMIGEIPDAFKEARAMIDRAERIRLDQGKR